MGSICNASKKSTLAKVYTYFFSFEKYLLFFYLMTTTYIYIKSMDLQ